jgi:hypothetical protein
LAQQNGFGLLMGVGFVAVVAMFARGQLAHFVPEMTGLHNVAVAQAHGLAALAADVGFVALIRVVGVDVIKLRIVSKSEARKAGHGIVETPAVIISCQPGTFISNANRLPNSRSAPPNAINISEEYLGQGSSNSRKNPSVNYTTGFLPIKKRIH